MGWDLEDCIRFFYKEDFKGDLPGIDMENDGLPPYKELNQQQRDLVEEAYWEEQDRKESLRNPEYYYGTSR